MLRLLLFDHEKRMRATALGGVMTLFGGAVVFERQSRKSVVNCTRATEGC